MEAGPKFFRNLGWQLYFVLVQHLLVLSEAVRVLLLDLSVKPGELHDFFRLPLIHLLIDLVGLFLEVLDGQFSGLLDGCLLLLELGVLLALLLLHYRHLDVLSLDHSGGFAIA